MKIKGYNVTKKMVIISLAVLLIAGVASAALVSYISNSLSANVRVDSPLVLQGFIGAEDDIATIESTLGAVPSGAVGPQTVTMSMFGGDEITYTVRMANRGAKDINGGFSFTLAGPDVFTTNLDEFDVTGIRYYESGVWQPNVLNEPACTGAGFYWGVGKCWANFKSLMAGLGGSNPVTMNIPSGLTFIPGSVYGQFLVKANVAIAPGDYSVITQITP